MEKRNDLVKFYFGRNGQKDGTAYIDVFKPVMVLERTASKGLQPISSIGDYDIDDSNDLNVLLLQKRNGELLTFAGGVYLMMTCGRFMSLTEVEHAVFDPLEVL